MSSKCSNPIWPLKTLASVVSILGLFVLAVTPAVAGVGGSDTPTWPGTAVVGETFAANVFITNTSTAPNDTENVQLTSLFVTPSCADSASPICLGGNVDPGVFQIVSAIGNAGTAPCAGVPFTIGVPNAVTGEVQLTPTVTVTLAPTNPLGGNISCLVDLQLLVLKVPANPVPPVPPGPPFTTDVLTRVALLGVNSQLAGSGAGSAQIQINKGEVTLQTASNPNTPNVVPGTSVSDFVTVTGPAGAATPTGSVRFILCQPSETGPGGCASPAGTKIGADKALVGGTATSDSTSDTTAIGTYCWRVRYLGDANYDVKNHTNATTECFATEAIQISEVCKTPGYYGTHPVITQAGLDAATLKIGGTLTICGQDISNISVPDPASAIEAICVKPATDKTLPLHGGRNLMVTALNCVANNPTPSPGATVCQGTSVNDLFEFCNAECAVVAAAHGGKQVIVDIGGTLIDCNVALDCYNNGFGYDPATNLCTLQPACEHELSLVGTCSASGTFCSDNVACPAGETCDESAADPASCQEAKGNTCTIFSAAC